MRLRSVFKMRISILNTATTEQMGYIVFSFFVCIKSRNQTYLAVAVSLCAEDENGELSLMVPEKKMPAGAEIC